ncbi:hypothetical protein BKA10_000726 [Microbacterium invictum]|uniref:Uncharacterized protein n=1 Tax=Microbacterium invictum TaxID=515415 RepID=A0AA40VLL1_9MICO|nr:hypothetical protein [Microbacterium invictum]
MMLYITSEAEAFTPARAGIVSFGAAQAPATPTAG